jgi:Flp pilus assembly pilin Flp
MTQWVAQGNGQPGDGKVANAGRDERSPSAELKRLSRLITAADKSSETSSAGKNINVRGHQRRDEMTKFLVSLLKDESGLTTVEYAVGAAVVTAGGIAAFLLLGQNVAAVINDLAGKIVTP